MGRAGANALRAPEPDDLARLRPDALFDLTGKVAVVTGASGGIGAWLATGLAAAGARVLATDHPRAPLDDLLAVLGDDAAGFACDLLDDDAPQRVVDAALERFGRVDVLVNNAGVNRRERIADVSRESWDLIAALDLRVPFELSRAAAAVMARAGEGGAIVHIGSLNNAIGLEGVSVYGAHKAAVCQLAKSMAIEWAGDGIRVNALCPGFMLTPLSKPLWDDPARGAWLMERSLMRRPGYADELVGACLLLTTRAGSFITGQAVYVEGGWLAGTPWSEGLYEPEADA